jgi:hypothetical protein
MERGVLRFDDPPVLYISPVIGSGEVFEVLWAGRFTEASDHVWDTTPSVATDTIDAMATSFLERTLPAGGERCLFL